MNAIIKIGSYIFDLPVEKKNSNYSGEVVVSIHEGQYKLSTQNAIYSFGKKYTSFDIAFQAIQVQQRNINEVLVLGFGLGSVVDLLEKQNTISSIIAVDIDEVIIDLAKKYLHTPLKSKVKFICADAIDYVSQETNKFDMLIVDLFIDDETPMPFMQADFLRKLKNLLSEDAVLLFSKIDDLQKHKIENIQFEQLFQQQFPNGFSIDAKGNKIFTWINSPTSF